jgi:hypothetical protein
MTVIRIAVWRLPAVKRIKKSHWQPLGISMPSLALRRAVRIDARVDFLLSADAMPSPASQQGSSNAQLRQGVRSSEL